MYKSIQKVVVVVITIICTTVCLALVPSTIYAAPQVVNIDELNGLQRNPKADKIEDGAHERFTNVYIKDGNIRSVKGRDRLNSTANTDTTVNGLCYYENAAGTTKKLILRDSDEVYSYAVDWTSGTVIANVATDEFMDCVQIGDTLYWNSSTDGLYKWTGSGAASTVGSVSAPSAVDFASSTSAGGMTPGEDAITSCCDSTAKDSTTHGSGFENDVSYDDHSCANCGTWTNVCTSGSSGYGVIITLATSSVYKYKTVKYSNLWGIESEPSVADSASLFGNRNIFYECLSTSANDNIIIAGEQTSTTGTFAAAPNAPFNVYRAYRTTAGGSDYFLAIEQDTGATTDGKPDSSLGDPLDTTIDTISPPSFRYAEEYKGVLFTAEEDTIRFSRLPVGAVTDADTYWLETDSITLSSERGFITGLQKTADSLLVFTGRSIHGLSGFGVNSFRLKNLIVETGAVTDEAIEVDSQGDIIFFAGVQGVYKLKTFQQPRADLSGESVGGQRIRLIKISSPINEVLLGTDSDIDLDPANYTSAHAYYDLDNDLYFLYIGEHCLLYDNRNNTWSYIPATLMTASLFRRSTNALGTGVIVDNKGFVFDNWTGYENGIESGTVTGTPTSSTNTTLTDTNATFNTTNDGLTGLWVYIDNESGEWRQITSNTASVLTVSTAWTVNPVTSDDYYVGYIIPDWKTKQYQFASPPKEIHIYDFWMVHNKSDSSQDLEFYTYEDKSTDPQRAENNVIDLTNNLFDKVGSQLRSAWTQWQFRTFIYNTSNTINPPVDITGYAINAEIEKER